MGEKELDHISPSSIDTYLICQRRWFFQHWLRLESFSSYPMYGGNIYHKFLELYYIDKALGVKSKFGYLEDKVHDYGKQEREENDIFWGQTSPGKVEDFALRGAKKHIKERSKDIIPDIVDGQPLVENTLEVELKSGIVLTGRTDIQTVEGTIVDHKTKNVQFKLRRITEYQMSQKMQPQIYLFMLPAYKRVKWEVALLGRKDINNSIYGLTNKRNYSHEQLEGFLDNLVSQMIYGLKNGVFVANYPHFLCTSRYCSYWDACHSTEYQDL